MPKVAFLIPASPVRAFYSQIAAFSLAVSRLNWHRWEPTVHVCMGGEPDIEAFRDWLPHLPDVATVFVPASVSASTPWYFAQYDGLHRWAPRDADVVVRTDADTLPVGDLEDLLDHVAETGSIAGVIAHFKFPAWPGTTSREAWLRIAQGLIDAPLDFAYTYSLVGTEVIEDDRITPFYVNFGAVFFPRAGFDRFSERYLALRPRLMDRLLHPYFAGQIALALAIADIGARTCALPMRYNFPNDELAADRFPEELNEVKIFHYLRTEAFYRHNIFVDSERYNAFIHMPLVGVNAVFQRYVKEIIGEENPFAGAQPGMRTDKVLSARPEFESTRRIEDPLSLAAFNSAIADNQAIIAPALARIEAEIADFIDRGGGLPAASSKRTATVDLL